MPSRGYRKAIRLMQLADRSACRSSPWSTRCRIPGVDANARPAEHLALAAPCWLQVPIIAAIVAKADRGDGSNRAANRVLMFEHASIR